IVYEGFGDPRLNYECFAETSDIYLFGRTGHPLFTQKKFSIDDISKYPLLEIDNYSDVA
ncbi:MAG TPA: LysR family transcriptional regulator, partial [Sutterellaceae bacterium]|nr:LysR family transcriptional regulator [Sutterellaceae bacterium]